MGARKDIGVFVSYARTDGAELAQRLCQDLKAETGFDVWLDAQRLAGGATWTTAIEEAIDRCNVMLALLTPGSYRSDVCRAEQLRALRKGKCVIPLVGERGSDLPVHLESKQYHDFSRAYPGAFRKLVADIRAGKTGVPLKEEFRKTYVTAPPLPHNYVERPESLARLRDRVIRERGGASIALTALKGMGGIGKTVLAQALCHDDVVQQAFPDGVVWVTTGREPAYDLATRMREVRRALKDDFGTGETELESINRYRSLMREKAALVIVDDVWNSRDVEPFRAESARSRILFTTRDGSIAAALGAEEEIADLPTVKQSGQVLARWCGTDVEDLPYQAGDLIRECGQLPLALAMIGATLRGKSREYWGHVLNLLRSADLARIKVAFPDYPHQDLFRAMQVSVDALEPETRARYFALAVVLEGMAVAPAIQQVLWNASEAEAMETAERLISLSFAQRDGDGIRLHDLQLDYVRAHYAGGHALPLIHGAVRLSAGAIEKDARQFASQMIGRLLQRRNDPQAQRFSGSLASAVRWPWLRPLNPVLHPPGTGLVRTLEGHSAWVYSVAVTRDGQRAVSACWDGTLRIWDLTTGHSIRVLEGHSGPANAVAVTPDGRRAVSASDDRTLRVWDLESGRTIRTLEGHCGRVNGVAVTPDGRRAVSASDDKTLRVWDLETSCAPRMLKGHCGHVTAVAASADGQRVLSGFENGMLKLWDLESGHALRTLERHSGRVNGVAVTPDGRRAVSASNDDTLKVWDLGTGQAVRTLEGHSDSAIGVALSPDGRRVVSASRDRTLKVWELESGRVLRTFEGHFDRVFGVAVTPDGRLAVSASRDKTVKVWDIETGDAPQLLEGHSDVVTSVAARPGGQQIISSSADKTLKIWDRETGHVLRTLEGHASAVTKAAVSPDGRWVVSASWDKTLKLWDLETDKEVRTLTGHTGPINGVALCAGRQWAVSASRDKTLKVWDIETGGLVRTLEGHTGCVRNVAVGPDGRWTISAADDCTLRVWDLETGRAIRTMEGHSHRVNDVAVSVDGRRVVSASDDCALKVWDTDTGGALRILEGHSKGVTGVAVSPDGRYVVSTSYDHTLRVWDLDTGAPVSTFTCDAAARSCAFAGARVIVAGDMGGRVHFMALEFPGGGS